MKHNLTRFVSRFLVDLSSQADPGRKKIELEVIHISIKTDVSRYFKTEQHKHEAFCEFVSRFL